MAAMTNGPGLLVFPTTLKEGGLAVAEGGRYYYALKLKQHQNDLPFLGS